MSKDQVSKKKRYQFVVPDSLKSEVLQGIHDCAGHQGQFRSLSLARQRFFWPHIDRDVKDYVRQCPRCVISKTPDPEGRAPLESIKTSAPLEIVCIDFWTAEDANNRSVNVLVVTDHFTRLAQAFTCRDQSAKQVAKQLWNEYFCIYGFPERIHSDQGASFESQLISELLTVAGVKKSRTTPYHPMGNGSVERFNRTLGNMIRALSPDVKRSWPQQLQTLTFMYYCTVNEATGYPPFYLMFGRVPRLPVDVLFKNILKDPETSGYDSYVVSLTKDLKEAMAIAQKHVDKEQNRQAEHYNRRVKGKSITVGDRVLVSNKRDRGKRKTADRWESTIYTVVSVNTPTHTYRIKNPVTGRERVVHRNLLMLVNFLPVGVDSPSGSTVVSSCVGTDDVTDVDGLLTVVEEGVVGNRTQEWVENLVDVSSDASGEDGSESADAQNVNGVPGDASSSLLQSHVEMDSDHTSAHVSSAATPRSSTQSAGAVPSEDVCSVRTFPTHSDSSTIHRVRTRVGRMVKPVNRLLHVMSNQVAVGDAGQFIDKVSKSMFHMFQ